MGWDGSYYAGSVKDWIKNGEFERRHERYAGDGTGWKVLAKSVKGNTIYSAIRHPTGEVFGLVTLLRKNRDGDIMVKDMSEDMGPCESECPEKILALLSPTDAEYAIAWRERCRNNKNIVKANKGKRAELDRLPIGSRIMFNGQEHRAFENVWRNTKAEGSTVFINVSNNRYSRKNQIVKTGWSVVG